MNKSNSIRSEKSSTVVENKCSLCGDKCPHCGREIEDDGRYFVKIWNAAGKTLLETAVCLWCAERIPGSSQIKELIPDRLKAARNARIKAKREEILKGVN